jgi:hypothetical protein
VERVAAFLDVLSPIDMFQLLYRSASGVKLSAIGLMLPAVSFQLET